MSYSKSNEDRIIKNCDNYQKMNRSSNNFSIEYILNKAGRSQITIRNVQFEKTKYHEINSEKIVNDNNQIFPVFDWLNYTRYKPPKLPRSLRIGPTKRTPGRLPRVPFTPAQLNALESSYKESNYLSSEEANKLATELELTNTRVKIWFQNRRARERRERREKEMNSNLISSSSLSPEHESETINVEI